MPLLVVGVVGKGRLVGTCQINFEGCGAFAALHITRREGDLSHSELDHLLDELKLILHGAEAEETTLVMVGGVILETTGQQNRERNTYNVLQNVVNAYQDKNHLLAMLATQLCTRPVFGLERGDQPPLHPLEIHF